MDGKADERIRCKGWVNEMRVLHLAMGIWCRASVGFALLTPTLCRRNRDHDNFARHALARRLAALTCKALLLQCALRKADSDTMAPQPPTTLSYDAAVTPLPSLGRQTIPSRPNFAIGFEVGGVLFFVLPPSQIRPP